MTEFQEHIIYLQIKTNDRLKKASEGTLHGCTDLLFTAVKQQTFILVVSTLFWELYSAPTVRLIQTRCCTPLVSQALHSATTASHSGSLSSQIKDTSSPALFIMYLGIPFFSTDTIYQQVSHPLKVSLLCSHLSQVCYFPVHKVAYY